MVLPKKRSTTSKPKIKRISHQYIGQRVKKKPLKKSEEKQIVQQHPQQQTYTAQPAQTAPQQTPAQQAQISQQVQQPIQQMPKQPNWWQFLTMMIIVGVIIFTVVSLMSGSNSGGSGVKCPTSCGSGAIVIYPTCNCPSDSYLSPTTPYIRGGQYDGYKQCICR